MNDKIEIPDSVNNDLYRCRVSYTHEIEKIEFFKYELKHPHKIKIVEDNSIDYSYKYENRSIFSGLVEQNIGFDDVIVSQNGLLTDATYSNLALFDGKYWITPKNYLLNGTKRAFLLDNYQIIEKEVKVSDLQNFTKIAFINAMRELEINYYFEIHNDSAIELWR